MDALALRGRAEALAGGEHVADRGEVPGVGQKQVEEPRAGDLDLLDLPAEPLLQRGAEPLGDLPRRHPERGR
jgi:hypothetical protein